MLTSNKRGLENQTGEELGGRAVAMIQASAALRLLRNNPLRTLISVYNIGHCMYRMPEPHHLIMYSCDCLSTPLGSSYVLAGLFSDNPGPSCPDPKVWTVVALL